MIPQENIDGLEEKLNEDIQRAYLTCFEKADNYYGARELKNPSGIIPSFESVQKGYMFLLATGWNLEAMDYLKEFSNIDMDPNFEDMKEGIQYVYFSLLCLSVPIIVLNSFKEICKTDIDVSSKEMNDALQKRYMKIFKEGRIDEAIKLQEFTGVDPCQEIIDKYPEYFGDAE